MIGISKIASYIPKNYIKNKNYKNKFNISDEFIIKKIGIEKKPNLILSETTADIAIKAVEKLL